MTLEERAKDIGTSWEGDGERGQILADQILSALRYAQAEAYAKAAAVAELVKGSAYDRECEDAYDCATLIADRIRNLATDGDKP